MAPLSPNSADSSFTFTIIIKLLTERQKKSYVNQATNSARKKFYNVVTNMTKRKIDGECGLILYEQFMSKSRLFQIYDGCK